MNPIWINAYTHRRLSWGWWSSWGIFFEDDSRPIRIVSYKSDAESFVGALNGAYNLGRHREAIDRSFSNES